jgi:branched-chain amino acid transport system ATP-binding protein
MALLDRFRLGRYASTLAGTLSYGHQRRVEMARAVASEPGILLLDEPVAGMNDVEASELGEIFQELTTHNIGLLLIEHNIRFVTSLSKHIYVMASGRVIAEGLPNDVMRNDEVVVAYLGKR